MADGVRLPGAVWRPFTERTVSSTPWTGPLTWIIHTIGKGSALGAWNYHNEVGKPYVQLYYNNLGVPYQVTGLEYRAAGTLELNPYVIASETADYGPGFGEWDGRCGHVPPFTDEQVAGYIRDLTWTFLRFGGEPVLMTESCAPLGGIGWHRLSIEPWVQDGCLVGSTSAGKCCPDDARISQIIRDIQPDVARNVAEARSPTPAIPEEEEMLLVTSPAGASLLVLGGQGAIGMTATDRTAYRDAGIPEAVVSSDGWSRFQRLPRLDVVA